MGILEWATSPWGEDVPIHVAWVLAWVAVVAGLAFFVAHAAYVHFFGKEAAFATDASAHAVGVATSDASPALPTRIPRHSLTARLFHWIMAGAMLMLLGTAFLPALGMHFAWVMTHWIAGAVLTASIAFHVVHALFWQDFWAIWPDRTDREDAGRRLKRFLGRPAPPPRRFAKYPLENKLYHTVVSVCGLGVIVTGVLMMWRVRTPFFPRNPYLFGDMTWGVVYVLHGLAGVGLITLVMVHIYFGLRPEKLVITKAMIFGWMSRDYYLKEHDPARWVVTPKGGS